MKSLKTDREILECSIKELEEYDFNPNLETKLYLDPEDKDIVVFEHFGGGMPMKAFHNCWVYLCTLPKKVIPCTVVSELLDHISDMETLINLYEGEEWNGHNWIGTWSDVQKKEDVLSSMDFNFGMYWDASEYLEPVYEEIVELLAFGESTVKEIAADYCSTTNDNIEIKLDDCIEHIEKILEDNEFYIIKCRKNRYCP